MTTILFVHGTGARQAGVDTIVGQLTEGLSRVAPKAVIQASSWGERVGSRLHRDGASIPHGPSRRGPDSAADGDAVVLWTLLELDPLFELRLLAIGPAAGELSPGTVPPQVTIGQAVSRFRDDEPLQEVLLQAGLQRVFPGAVAQVLASEPTRQALVQGETAQVCAALARAFVATALLHADRADQAMTPVHGDSRDELVRIIEARLGLGTRGIFGEMAWAGVQLAVSLGATGVVERKRQMLTHAASPMAGDIMTYLARGSAMRRVLAEEIAAVSGPVMLVGHSLGGIISLETLCERELPNVVALCTVGSQTSYLYELNALPLLPFGDELPPTVPARWINVFDQRDLLSFVAEPLFGSRVVDHQVDNRAPFPRSHSAYFANPRLYELLAATIATVPA